MPLESNPSRDPCLPNLATATAALRLQAVHKHYGAQLALAGLDIDVQPGEIFGLLGPNGAGKSTALHIATGLLGVDRGSVQVLGGDPRQPALRRRFGIAPQRLSLYEHLSGRENLTFFARCHGLSGEHLRHRVDAALAFVALADRGRDRVGAYSGGMQRRLNIAAAICHDPELILLDEPTVGVDPQSRNAIFDNVLALKRQGRTVVYTTHYMEEAERLCDRIAIVDRGRLLAVDTLTGLLKTYGGNPQLRIRRAGVEQAITTATPMVELERAIADGGVEAFAWSPPSLEQVFLGLTGRALRDRP